MNQFMKSPYVSFVIPVYNCEVYLEQSIEAVLDFFGKQNYVVEVIIVDDASTDGTPALLQRYRGELRIVTNAINRGKGFAVRRGVLVSTGDYVLFTDADIPFGFEPIHRFLAALDRGGYDVVIGARDPAQSIQAMKPSWARRVGSQLFTWLVSSLLTPGVRDTQCGLKGFRRSAAHALFSMSRIDRFAFDVEVVSLALRKGYRLDRQPVTVESCAPTSVRLVFDGLIATRDLLLFQWRCFRGWYK